MASKSWFIVVAIIVSVLQGLEGSILHPPMVLPPSTQDSMPPTLPDNGSKEDTPSKAPSPTVEIQAPNFPTRAGQAATPSNAISPISHTVKGRPKPGNHEVTHGSTPSPLSPGPAVSPVLFYPPITRGKRDSQPVAAPPMLMSHHLSPVKKSPIPGFSPLRTPKPFEASDPPNNVPPPHFSFSHPPQTKGDENGPRPMIPLHRHHPRKSSPSPAPSNLFPQPSNRQVGPVITPATSPSPIGLPNIKRRRHFVPPVAHGPSFSPIQSPSSPPVSEGAPAHSVSVAPPKPNPWTIQSPTISPSGSISKQPMTPVSPPLRVLPPPPPNLDCTSFSCTDPLTNTPPGAPCACVLPMQVELRLGVALYAFFPLVSELAQEIAAGVFMSQSQVRIMGANAATDQPDKTIVLIDLVPLGQSFDNTTSLLTFEKFWHKQIGIKSSFFGKYEVLYVRYPGLPPSPPVPSNINVEDGPFANNNNGRTIQPLGVDVRRQHKEKIGGSLIAIIVLSSVIAVFLSIVAAWFLLLKCRNYVHRHSPQQDLLPSLAKTSEIAGTRPTIYGSGPSSASMSFSSSMATYTISAKTFSAVEIEKATKRFDPSEIIGEGGFGRVYRGLLEDGTCVAVKVLKRDDQQGSREFLAEVEMLSRLHHRNLVKLIGICTEEHARCLIYELVPNGSVDSHLHGADKETAPLDWGARMKIALGSARGLAYLHEDSSPRVIHRDFKSSNILLENDFTPKVSDFGLARTALDEGNEHISTRVMGTFGYVAPEYAMTGHLLVKSDVYSYGVVLLELLTGRKPVDMLQPAGQENLVTWARPLLTSREGLEIIIDPSLGSNFPFDSVAKVAAIASMCVQPEVSHRPFMGEVVQALKLVCNESGDEYMGSASVSLEDSSIVDIEARMSMGSGRHTETRTFVTAEYDSSPEPEIFSIPAVARQVSGSFRRHSSSGPLRTTQSTPFWQRVRALSRGSLSEHGTALRYGMVWREANIGHKNICSFTNSFCQLCQIWGRGKDKCVEICLN
ncbi:Receptor-like serine/threonine-protein kinase ALE2 [Acorus calamus]|uniref:Receptor-like serine/threonine-protein kinase ALE2 n=1 Tax=Acorus calamus TaxID=4465 RepID=A0AAV9C0C9_ACOCL|nr:Receptor-like serine/threonine-protein kinase ALE2 [Acorus calamus]